MGIKTIKQITPALLFLAASSLLHAQEQPVSKVNQPVYYRPTNPMDWKPESKTANRYSLSVHPFHLMNSGLKLDFETEFTPEKWLQVGAMGYYRPRFNDHESEWREGWESLNSNYEPFSKLSGAGLSLSYKSMFDSRGWYFNTGVLYNYYDVDYEELRYVPVQQDGLTFYERRFLMVTTKFHQPAVFFNAGKHMAITRHLFADVFIGLGYMHSFYSGGPTPFDEYVAFGYRGVYFNGGFRIGILWNGKTR